MQALFRELKEHTVFLRLSSDTPKTKVPQTVLALRGSYLVSSELPLCPACDGCCGPVVVVVVAWVPMLFAALGSYAFRLGSYAVVALGSYGFLALGSYGLLAVLACLACLLCLLGLLALLAWLACLLCFPNVCRATLSN